jgi:hypothetical protein
MGASAASRSTQCGRALCAVGQSHSQPGGGSSTARRLMSDFSPSLDASVRRSHSACRAGWCSASRQGSCDVLHSHCGLPPSPAAPTTNSAILCVAVAVPRPSVRGARAP